MKNNVLIVGGGPAGLEASSQLQRLGYNVILIERSTALGGHPEYHTLVIDTERLHLTRLLGCLVINMTHGGLECRCAPIDIAQRCAIVAHIVDSRLGIPQHSTLYTRQLAMECHLSRQLVTVLISQVRIFHSTFHILTDIKVGMGQVVVPPMNELAVVGSLVANLPVNLRYAVVHPSFLVP